MMNLLTWLSKLDTRQWGAASRQYITFGAGILTAVALITTTQSQDLVKNLGDFVSGATQVATGVAALAAAILAIKNSFTAAHNAGPEVAVQRVQEIAQDPTQPVSRDAKAALVTAAVSLPEVKNIEIAPADSSREAKAEVVALNAATPSAVVMNPVPQTQ